MLQSSKQNMHWTKPKQETMKIAESAGILILYSPLVSLQRYIRDQGGTYRHRSFLSFFLTEQL